MSTDSHMPMLTFRCSNCGHRLTAPLTAVGQHAPCPRCGFEARVPSPRRKDADAIEDDGQLNMPSRPRHINYHDSLDNEAHQHHRDQLANTHAPGAQSHPLRLPLIVFNIVMLFVIVALVIYLILGD